MHRCSSRSSTVMAAGVAFPYIVCSSSLDFSGQSLFFHSDKQLHLPFTKLSNSLATYKLLLALLCTNVWRTSVLFPLPRVAIGAKHDVGGHSFLVAGL